MIRTALRRQLAHAGKTPKTTKRYAHAPIALNWADPLDSASLFTEEELAISETANSYCQERMLPRVLGAPILHLMSRNADAASQMRIGMNNMIARSSKKWES